LYSIYANFPSFEATTDVIEPFPPGLRMVVGNPNLRTPPATGGESITDLSDGVPQPVQWVCPRTNTNTPLYPPNSDGLHGVGIQDPGNAGAGVGFPDQNCDGYASPLRADIHFPSCWNKTAGLDDYKTNMQFPTNGNCPAGFVHLPHLFYEVYWNTPLFASRWTQGQGTQPFVLSNGDPTGYGLHGDFLAGWDTATLTQIINNCNAGDSGMDKCPGLIGGLNDPSTSCNEASPIDEVISGTLSKLPGNNPVGQWGVNAAGSAPGSASVVSETLPTSTPASGNTGGTGGTGNTGNTKVVATPTATGVESGPAPTESSAGVETYSVIPVPETTTPAIVTPASVAPASGGSGDTIVTKVVSETTYAYTTITLYGPAPTDASEPDVDGWSYYGCYADTRARVLTGIELANIGNHEVTNTKCVAYCGAAGFSMAGTEYGGQCFCGNELEGSSKLAESSCDMPCEGDGTQTCGGSLALSVYTSATKKRSIRHMHRHRNGFSS
jgi:hypothetical protein